MTAQIPEKGGRGEREREREREHDKAHIFHIPRQLKFMANSNHKLIVTYL